MDGSYRVQEGKARPGDTEKITINLGFIDLGTIDLLVKEGFTPIERTSSEPRSAISSQLMPMW
jgi:hypothetical protein